MNFLYGRFYMMMRINFKTILMILIVAVISSILTSWNGCNAGYFLMMRNGHAQHRVRLANTEPGYQEIDCNINGEYLINCRREGGEVYIPFSFIKKYFEVYGEPVNYDGLERFEWSHSKSKMIRPKGKYDSRGVYMTFENYNVEVRERVKCVTGLHGVPMSTQWESQGYYYPTQIAQFGLSHYSKNLTEPEPHRQVLEDAERIKQNWQVPQGSVLSRPYDIKTNTYVLKYASSGSQGISLDLNYSCSLILKFDVSMENGGNITLVIQHRDKKDPYYLHYTTTPIVLETTNNNISYGINSTNNHWRRLTRDLLIDLQKGLNFNDKGKIKKLAKTKLKLVKMILNGSGRIDNITLSTSEHMEQFYDSAKWFVVNQNVTSGGWANPVKRKVASGMATLEPGWYSAMGQGHGISVLSRAYYHSGEERYLQAAIRALKPYKVASNNGGVAAMFLDKFVWYEEYPTSPSSFILNGFIYSLIGLYDLKSIASGKDAEEALELFNKGMHSLKNMLTLFDTGYGTIYDLRHFTLKTAPNLARWDYHSAHINQLLLLSTIDNDPLFGITAERWIGYMNGKRAAHN